MRNARSFSLFACSLLSLLILIPHAFAENTQAFDVVKGPKSVSFSLPYGVANNDEKNATLYRYDNPVGQNWILGITNNVTYAGGNDSRVVVRLQEPAPSQKFIDIIMYGGPNYSYAVGVNGSDSGYSVIYSEDQQGWSTDGSISVSHADNQGLTVTDGKRIVVDRLDIQGFNLGSVAVYGKQNATAPDNALAGKISVEVLYGNPSDSPTYWVPLGVMLGMGGLMGVLLFFKRRKS